MLADCHIHMILDGADWRAALEAQKDSPKDSLIRQKLEQYRAMGYAYLRDGGDRWGVCHRARALAAEYGIEYRSPGFPIYKKGYYGGFIGRGFETMEQYAQLVAQAKAQGADFIKVMISGIMDFDRFGVLSCPGLAPGQIREMVAIAHGAGLAVMAHANGAETVAAAARAGADSVEHGAYLDREALEAMAERGTVWVPTLAAIGNLRGAGRYDPEAVSAILASAQENIGKFAEMGGLLAPGSDAGAWRVCHGRGGLEERALLAQVLGQQTDAILARGTQRLMEVFRPQP